jgi:hypothetical protein
VFGTKHPLFHGQQRRVLVAGPGRIPRLPGGIGEVKAGGQGVRILGAGHSLDYRQQRGEQVAGPGRIPARQVQRAKSKRPVRICGCSGLAH